MSASFLEQARELLATSEVPELGPGPREGVNTVEAINSRLETIVSEAGLSPGRVSLIRSLVLLWHDHFDASHELSQSIESSDGSYVHGILHRREPDYSNAKYWFRRVGDHACFPALAERAAEILDGSAFEGSLGGGGNWDPYAFIDACEEMEGETSAGVALLRRVQAVEFELLLERFAG